MRKTVFIIPGYKQKPTSRAYREIAKILKKEGYSPVLINLPWNRTTVSKNAKYFLKKYKKINTRKKYILGFSFGAMIAFIASTKVSPSGLILCSLSPYFKEDISKINTEGISSLMTDDFSKLDCLVLAKRIKAKQILMLYGAKEERSLKNRVNKAYEEISCEDKLLIRIKETEHNIGNKRYLNTIHQAAKELI